MLHDHLAPRKNPRWTAPTRISKPERALTRQEREDLADAAALRMVGGATLLFHMTVVDPTNNFEPIEGTGLDLVVSCVSPSAAYVAWERHADSVGAVGAYCVRMVFTPTARAGRRQPEVDETRMVDLDWLALSDALEPLDDEDLALGLAVYR
ncbi:hypothetical protein MKK88_04655 [Methylobacterium sp. E-005]|uniref:hypothetical protein n=1 Tax=Methylobacterium sp. E-005 TaxID=2836549 RepID=UPI001FBB5A11|nr:hypothetical protein [Methylobacterium sp. E-005]MCJ2085287.1 hypothetical protein [Methylobacterium sp. E-005]